MKKATKVTIYFTIVIVGAVGLLIGGIFAIKSIAKSRQKAEERKENKAYYANCVHWTEKNGLEGFVEPTLAVGKYYLDGDTSKQYYEVLADGSIQLKNADYVAMAETHFRDIDHNDPNFQEQVAWYEAKYYPTISTLHGMDDKVCVFMNNESKVGGSALTYIVAENTLTEGKNPQTGEPFTYVNVQ
jgi:hypothetical protein